MVLFGLFLFIILTVIFFVIGDISDSFSISMAGLVCCVVTILILIFGMFNGFINKPPTEGTHQGIITAVDLEGVWFRRYEVYLKSGGYSQDSTTKMSDETRYLLYESEKDLADELKSAIGKEVQINYGHDGGYIPWNSCGTYHIKSFKIVEGE